jgi:hypothetical protein
MSMAALLRRRPRVHTVPVNLGESSIAALADRVRQLLTDRNVLVVLDVVTFEFFDQHTLTALTDLVDSDDRISLRGLDDYAETLLTAQAPPAEIVDVRTAAERSLTHLASVTVINAVVDGQPLDDATWDDALTLARAAGRHMVTLDLRAFPALTAHQALSLAEFTADLVRELRMLIVVNAHPRVADQLRVAGLHGELLLGIDDQI